MSFGGRSGMSICVLHLRKQQSHRLQVKPSQSISSCDSKRHPHPFGKVATGISGKVIALRGSLVFWAWCCPGGLGGRASNESLQQSSIFSSSRHLLGFSSRCPRGEKNENYCRDWLLTSRPRCRSINMLYTRP